MTSLERLKSANSLNDIAMLLGFKPASLAYVIYKLPDSKKYIEFEIPKRNGGVRKIKAPEARLKLLQRRLSSLLYACIHDIENNAEPRRPLAHGFTKCLSIITNASSHKRRRYVLNLDLKDFFPSINFGRVRGILIKDKRFELKPAIATIIAQIACHDNTLPQGSPCSPILSNIVAHILDIRMVRLAKKHKCTYSRYADDITFSTNQASFPHALAAQNGEVEDKWELGKELISGIHGTGFEINDAKTRMQVRGSRQIATGLIVNEKVNIRPEYYRTARSMCNSLFASGSYYQMIPAAILGGKPEESAVKRIETSLAPLEGMLSHIYHVRNIVDSRTSIEKKKNSTSTRNLYYRFLFYKNFIALDKPLIIPEGKTDSIYIESAIRKMIATYPKLGRVDAGKLIKAFRILNTTTTIHDVLQLGGGTGDFKFFVLKYKEMADSYKHCLALFPVILLIDNDDGAKEIFSVMKQLKVPNCRHDATCPFFKIYKNLYLIKTPEAKSSPYTSCIEDLFSDELRNTILDGKTFDPNKKHNEHGKYGKMRFAERVIKPNVESIDFSSFTKLIDRIVAVIDDYVSCHISR